MNKRPSFQSLGLALNFEGANVPDWIQLTPAGPAFSGRDGRSWTMSDPQSVVERFKAQNWDLPVDIDHSTETVEPGTPAPAVGHIQELDVRDGALWGRVAWNDTGRQLLSARAYKYISPVFYFTAENDVHSMVSAALVHRPNLMMQALNSKQETNTMDPAILAALGLSSGASAADAVLAINALKEDKQKALNSAQTPDPEKFVPKADHQMALNKIADFEAADEGRAELAMNAAVDAATEAGKIAPASRDYHLATCKAVGVEKFNEMMAPLPSINAKQDPVDPGKPALNALTDEDRAAAKALNMTEEEFLKAKSEG